MSDLKLKRNFYSCPSCGNLNEVATGSLLASMDPTFFKCSACHGAQGISSLLFVEIMRVDKIEDNKITTVDLYARGLVRIKPEHSLAIENHSPDGFEYGYGGSGPAQTSFAILLYFLGVESALYYKQAFKDRIIARLPQDHNYIGLFFDRKIWEVI